MDVLRIYLFGKFDVRCNGQTLNSFDARKVQELFCYLLLNRDRPHHRESLASLLWPKHTTAKSLKYLRNTLWQLQIALDASLAIENSNVLLIDPEWISLIPEAPLWLDVAEFERACALVQGKQGQKLDEQEIRVIQEALELYRGDLLEGWFQDWRLFEQERLRRMYLALLEKLIAHCEAHGEYQAGIDYTTRALRYDAAHERVHRRLMRLHYRAGNRTEALRQYKRCVTSLHQELGVGPSQRTVTLYKQIRAGCPLDSDALVPKSVTDIDPLQHLLELQKLARAGRPLDSDAIMPKEATVVQLTVLLESSIQEFTSTEQENFIHTLSQIININPERIRILQTVPGSVRITLEMPEEAAQRFFKMYLAEEPTLKELHISKVELSRTITPDVLERKVEPGIHKSAQLRHLLTIHFNESELHNLCFDLHVDYETLPGDGKADKARELVAHFDRRNRLSDLVGMVKQMRPDIPW